MNWTGGRLQRSKDANKGIIQKQKAHFARARTQLQNSTPASTPAFPSDLFCNKSVSQHPQLLLSSARTARLTGHSRTLWGHDKSIGASPVRHERPGTRDVPEESPLHGHDRASTAASGNTNRKCAPRFHTDQMHLAIRSADIVLRQTPSGQKPGR
jgi:hypothetical protein